MATLNSKFDQKIGFSNGCVQFGPKQHHHPPPLGRHGARWPGRPQRYRSHTVCTRNRMATLHSESGALVGCRAEGVNVTLHPRLHLERRKLMKTDNTITKKERPEKPFPEFPLFAHASGQWAKKIAGRTRYFGVWDNPFGALRAYQEQIDDLRAGREPANNGVSLRYLVNEFLRWKEKRMDNGQLSGRQFTDYYDCCEQILTTLGKNTHVQNLRPIDFEELRGSFAKKHGPHRLAKDITMARTLFRYAGTVFGITVRIGADFVKPTAAELREARRKKWFEPVQLQAALDKANPTMKAIILIGLNAGLGNEDIAAVAPSNIAGEWLNYPRSKTGGERRAWLWPETRDALAEAKGDSKHVFLRPNGKTWHSDVRRDKKRRVVIDNVLSRAFNKLVPGRPTGVSFYTLRHIFWTVAKRTKDKEAARAVMGHVPNSDDVATIHYDEDRLSDGILDDRIKAVCAVVRVWLYEPKS